jgi:hypothetical protein
VSLSQQARTILKSIDPNNQILSPSANLEKLDTYLAAGGGSSTDIISHHFYLVCDATPPAGVPMLIPSPERMYKRDIAQLRALVDRYGFTTKPIWNTEVGRGCATNLSESLAAAYVARSLILNQAGGIGRHYFYAWDTPNPNAANLSLWLTNPGSNSTYDTLTPAGVAYREVAKWLIGNKVIAVDTSTNNWNVKLVDSAGRFSYIIWNPSSSGIVTIPSGVNLKRDLAGGASVVTSGNSLSVDGSPVILSQGILVDNLAAGATGTGVTFTGLWCLSGSPNQYGTSSLYNSRGLPADCGAPTPPPPANSTYRWTTPSLLGGTAGNYDVYVWWSTHPNRSSTVPISVKHNGGVTSKNYDQRVGGGQWVLHGRYNFQANTTGYVEVDGTNDGTNGKQAAADAVLFVPVP